MANVATGGYYGAKKLGKQQARAAQEIADAMEKAPTIQSAAEQAPATTESADTEANVNQQTKRRFKLSDTTRNPLAPLTGLRKTLG